jgi:hypothetical protein
MPWLMSKQGAQKEKWWLRLSKLNLTKGNFQKPLVLIDEFTKTINNSNFDPGLFSPNPSPLGSAETVTERRLCSFDLACLGSAETKITSALSKTGYWKLPKGNAQLV